MTVPGMETARRAVDLARRKGISVEAYHSSGRQLEIRCFEGEVEHFERAESAGLGLRVVREGRVGAAYTEDLSPGAVEETLAAAADIAGSVEPQRGVELSDWPAPPELGGLDCPELAALPVEKKIRLVLEMEAAAHSSDAAVVNVPLAGYDETLSETFLCSTAGLERSTRRGGAVLVVEAVAGRGDERKSRHDFCFARRREELRPAEIGRRAGLAAASLLGARQPASGRADVLFAPRAFASLLGIFSAAFSGRHAEEQRTPLAGRIGHRLGPAGLNLVDDATLTGGPASRPCDAEGVPSRRLSVVEGGELRSFLHTADTARRASVAPTGHAWRSYQTAPAVAPSNLFLPAGADAPEALRAGAAVEVVAVTGHAGASQVSGEFSLPVLGFALKGGRRTEPLHDFAVAGNLPGLLSAFRAAGSDFEFGAPGMTSAIGCGSVLVTGLSIAGKG